MTSVGGGFREGKTISSVQTLTQIFVKISIPVRFTDKILMIKVMLHLVKYSNSYIFVSFYGIPLCRNGEIIYRYRLIPFSYLDMSYKSHALELM